MDQSIKGKSFKVLTNIDEISNSISDEIKNSRIAKCAICNKEFLPAPLHIYRTRGKIYCSYTCARKDGWDK